MEDARRSWPRRLHAISGIVPVGAFLAFHLYTNTAAAGGAEAYNAAARRLQQFPLAAFIEIALIAAPIFFHAVYGLYIAATEAPGAPRPTPGRRAISIGQRVTGVIVFAFILFHLWTSRLVQIREHESLDLFRLMQAALASPWIRGFYVVGILCATAHVSAGLWSYSQTWGRAESPRARGTVAVVAAAVFLLLTVMGLRSLEAFRL